jgi:hypothetical protein
VVHLELSSPSAAGTGGLNPFGVQFTPEEEEEFNEMARSEEFYERFAKSVAPSIFGSLGTTCLQVFRTPGSLLARHQEGYFLSSLRWIEEDFTRWYALAGRHQRFAVG